MKEEYKVRKEEMEELKKRGGGRSAGGEGRISREPLGLKMKVIENWNR